MQPVTGRARRVVAIVVAAALAGCGDGPTAPADGFPALTESIETVGIVFHLSAGDAVESDWQQAYQDWLGARLGLSLPMKLEYNKYRNAAHLQQLSGAAGNAWTEIGRPVIHTIFSRDDHETVHAFMQTLGRPVGLFSEGMAVAHQVDPVAGDLEPRWSGTHVHTLARGFRQQGRLVPLADCLETADFVTFDPSVTYPQAGSFVSWLIEVHGLEAVKEIFRRVGPDDAGDRVRTAFRAAFGVDLDQSEGAWHAFLEAWPGG